MATESNRPWDIELVTNPDRVLSAERIGSSCDRAILDRGQRWFSPARGGIASRIPRARPGRTLMRLIQVQVECYAGAKADETPRRFKWEDRLVEVDKVLDRWYQVESRPEWPRAECFKVRGADQREYLLKHYLESDEWFLGQQR